MSIYPSQMVGIQITDACNLHDELSHSNVKMKRKFLSANAIGDFIDGLIKKGKPPIYLAGGEPFLHPDFWKIVDHIKESNLFLIINTNGSYLKDYMDQIISKGIDMLVISIDATAQIFDLYDKRKNLSEQVALGIREFDSKTEKKPIVAFHYLNTNHSENGKYTNKSTLEKLRTISSLDNKNKMPDNFKVENTIWVEPNGRVVPSTYFPDYELGNIYNDSFHSIWNGSKNSEFRYLAEQLFPSANSARRDLVHA